jgi:tetratricopeptide (TPR) repeat protein
MSDIVGSEKLATEDLLGQVVDDFLDRLHRGERPEINEYVQRYPQLARVLRQTLPALQLMQPSGAAGAEAGSFGNELHPEGPLGDFRLQREVGRGGMGIVYEAVQISLGRRVALKVLPFAATLDPRQLQRFKNEAQAAAQLHHTNIVPVYAVGCERGVHFYAMQFIEGHSLATVIHELRQHSGLDGREARGPENPPVAVPAGPAAPDSQATSPYSAGHAAHVSPEAARTTESAAQTAAQPATALSTERSHRSPAFFRAVTELGIQAAMALEHAHQLGVFHRDIKPANLLVDGRGNLWVTDFGLAHCQSQVSLTMTGDLVGTLRYMSPEQALAQRVSVDHRTDIYSLGATLYELLTLEPAVPGADREAVLRQIAFEEPKLPRKQNKAVPTELETIVLKSMAKNPDERYGTAQELADDLRRFLKDEPIRARRPTVVQRAWKWSRRHRPVLLALSAGLLFALLVGAAALGWILHDQATRSARAIENWGKAEKEARQLLADDRLDEAQAITLRLKRVMAYDEAGQELREQIRQLEKDLKMVVWLEEIRLEMSGASGRGWDYQRAEVRYAQAFREGYDIDLAEIGSAEVVTRISASEIRVPLAVALDHWAMTLKPPPEKDSGQPAAFHWKRLLTISRLADPDRLRKQLRDAFANEDVKALASIAAGDIQTLHPTSLDLLAQALTRNRRFQEAWDLLKKARRQYPRDFWLNQQYARYQADVSPPNLDEAIRYYTVALNLRPQSAGTHYNLGLVLARKGTLDESLAVFHRAQELAPRFAPVYSALAEALLRKGALDEARQAAQEAVRLEPNWAEGHAMLGTVLEKQGRADKAEACCCKALQLRPKFPGALNLLGTLRRNQKRPGEAEAYFRQAIEIWPAFAPAHSNLAGALADLGQPAQAQASYLKAIKLDPHSATAHYNYGRILHKDKQLAAAAQEYRQALNLQPDLPEAWANLGSVLHAQKRFNEAIPYHQKAIQLKPNLVMAHNNLGLTLREQNKPEQAIACFARAIELEPNYVAAHKHLGETLLLQRQWAKAAVTFRKVVELDPSDAESQFNLGSCQHQQKKLDAAADAYRTAVKLRPAMAEAHTNLGIVLFQLENLDAAAECYQRAIELYRQGHATNPRAAMPYYNLGTIYRRQKKLDEALVVYLKALKHRPSWAEAHVNLGLTFKDKGQPGEAVAYFRLAVNVKPDYALAHRHLADTLMRMSRLHEALPGYHRLLELQPKNAEAHQNLGVVLMRLGQWEEAITALQDGLRCCPEASGIHAHLAWCLATCPEPKLRDPARAIATANQALALAPQDAVAWQALGAARYRNGAWKASIAALEKSIALKKNTKGNDSAHWLLLAMAHWQLGNKAEARQWYERAIHWIGRQARPVPLVQALRSEAEQMLGAHNQP